MINPVSTSNISLISSNQDLFREEGLFSVARKALSELEVKCSPEIKDFPSLSQIAEVNELASELDKLEDLFRRGENVEEGFKELCRLREEQNRESSLSFSNHPDGACNQLYFDLAMKLFKPHRPSDLLEVLLPTVKEILILDPSEDRLLFDKQIGGVRKESITHLTWDGDLKTLFKDCVIAGGTLFDISQISSFNFALHTSLYQNLDKNYPAIREKLYSHNQVFESLMEEITLVLNGGPTLQEALLKLKESFIAGGASFTGNSQTASGRAEVQGVEFARYFALFTPEVQSTLKAIAEMESLLKGLENNECVEAMAGFITTILASQSKELLLRASLSADKEEEIKKKYGPQRALSLSGREKGMFPPTALSRALLQNIFISSLEELLDFLISIPADFYPLFLENSRLSTNVIGQMASIFPLLSPEKQNAFFLSLVRSPRDEFKVLFGRLLSEISDENLISILPQISLEKRLELLKVQDGNERTVLHRAANYSNPEVIKVLLEGVTREQRLEVMRIQDKDKRTALHLAASNSNPEVIKVLFEGVTRERRLELIKAQDRNGPSALHLAAMNSNPEVIKVLFEGVDPEQRLEVMRIQDKDKLTALHLAARDSNPEVIKVLLEGVTREQRLELMLMRIQDEYKRTALHLAAMNSNPEGIKVLLEGVTREQRLELLTVQDGDKHTALHLAARNSNPEVIKVLLDGLTREQRLELLKLRDFIGGAALHLAARNSNPEVIKVVFDGLTQEQRLELIRMQDGLGGPTLLWAVGSSNPEVIKALLEGVTQEQRLELMRMQGERGYTALHLAAMNSNPEVIKVLFEGVEPEQRLELIKAQDRDGLTALHLAARYSNPEVIKVVFDGLTQEQRLELIKAQDGDKHTALHRAAMNSNPEVIKVLFEGVDPEQRLELLKLQAALSRALLQNIFISSLEELLDFLISIPADFYPVFLENSRLSINVIGEMASIFPLLSTEKQNAFFLSLVRSPRDEFKALFVRLLREISDENLISILSQISLEKRLELLKVRDFTGEAALHRAAMNSNPEVIKVVFDGLTREQRLELLKVQDWNARTALHLAAMNSNPEVIKVLLDGLTREQRLELLKVQDRNGSTALHLAASNSNPEVIKVLLEGVTREQRLELLKVQDRNGRTALHSAARDSNPEVIKALLDGLTQEQRLELIRMQDRSGGTTLHLAATNSNPEVIKMLRDDAAAGEVLGLSARIGGFIRGLRALFN